MNKEPDGLWLPPYLMMAVSMGVTGLLRQWWMAVMIAALFICALADRVIRAIQTRTDTEGGEK